MSFFYLKTKTSEVSKALILVLLFLSLVITTSAQERRLDQNPKLDNLTHPSGYKTSKMGELGQITKVGYGPKDMILIAGLGFGGDIWNKFMSSRKEKYTMYAITLPGFGGTPAPPMPPDGTSYADQTWTKAAQMGVEKLITEKKLTSPIVIAHWSIATQVAIGLALDKPEQISKVILISGVSKNVMTDRQFKQKLTVAQRARYVDTGMAPKWFKTVTRDTWDDNNWDPSDYAKHPVRAMQLWRMAFKPTLPVHVRYLCESWAQDSTVGLETLKVPLLIIKPGFDKEYDELPGQRGGLRMLTQESWEGVEKLSNLISTVTIDNSRVFIMDDQPEKLNGAIELFLARSDKR